MSSLTLTPARWVAIACALLIVVASWWGVLDEQSEAYLDDALTTGAVVYATARMINASVSLLQGTEFNPMVMTISAGEVLDPINDLIERFSAILVVALGSLALQQIFLTIFSHAGFSLLLTVNLLVLLLCTLTPLAPYFRPAFRFLVVTAAIRFALSLTVLASAAVDQVFLAEADQARHAGMQELSSELATMSAADPGAPTQADVDGIEERLAGLRSLMADRQARVDGLLSDQGFKEAELTAARQNLPLGCQYNPFCDEGQRVAQLDTEKDAIEFELLGAKRLLRDSEDDIDSQEAALNCARLLRAGEPCSFWGLAKSWVSPTEWTKRFERLEVAMNDYATNIIALLTSMLVKTVLIPVLALYVLGAVVRGGLRRTI
ncbi:hypothetical protein [Pseudohaliea sp.]|uniref:hypothetical protein n=1 Tax=Pseudohaliea sp. TaxID=2740289 RepID=UPI0032EAA98B